MVRESPENSRNKMVDTQKSLEESVSNPKSGHGLFDVPIMLSTLIVGGVNSAENGFKLAQGLLLIKIEQL